MLQRQSQLDTHAKMIVSFVTVWRWKFTVLLLGVLVIGAALLHSRKQLYPLEVQVNATYTHTYTCALTYYDVVAIQMECTCCVHVRAGVCRVRTRRVRVLPGMYM